MNKATRERNQQIRSTFYARYGTMPTMLLYAQLACQHELSEESIRKIVKK